MVGHMARLPERLHEIGRHFGIVFDDQQSHH